MTSMCVAGLCEVVFEILGLATRDNQRNAVHISQSIDTLLYHYTVCVRERASLCVWGGEGTEGESEKA